MHVKCCEDEGHEMACNDDDHDDDGDDDGDDNDGMMMTNNNTSLTETRISSYHMITFIYFVQ